VVGCLNDSCEGVSWIEVAQDIVLWGTVKKLAVPEHFSSLLSILSLDSSRVRPNIPFMNNDKSRQESYLNCI
jgi:hypothetical protein